MRLGQKRYWFLIFLASIIAYSVIVLLFGFFESGLQFNEWLNATYILKWRDVLIPIFAGLICIFGYFYFRKIEVIGYE